MDWSHLPDDIPEAALTQSTYKAAPRHGHFSPITGLSAWPHTRGNAKKEH